MPDDMMTLCRLLEKSADADLVREMIGFAAERLMMCLLNLLVLRFGRVQIAGEEEVRWHKQPDV